MITIENHKLVSSPNDLEVSYEATPNHSGAFQNGLPDTIIIHYTAGSSMESSVNWLKNPKAQASAHLVVGKSGAVAQLVPFNTIAWHAGNSEWNGRKGLNNYSIGIEIDNAGLLEKQANGYYTYFGKPIPEDRVILARHKHGSEEEPWEAYTETQIAVVTDICMALKKQYNIVELLGHDDIAPDRKYDPGPAFPLQQLRDKVLLGRKTAPESKAGTPETTATTGTVIADYLNIRSKPTVYSSTVTKPLPKGTRVKIIAHEGAWSYVKAEVEGWVSTKWIQTP